MNENNSPKLKYVKELISKGYSNERAKILVKEKYHEFVSCYIFRKLSKEVESETIITFCQELQLNETIMMNAISICDLELKHKKKSAIHSSYHAQFVLSSIYLASIREKYVIDLKEMIRKYNLKYNTHVSDYQIYRVVNKFKPELGIAMNNIRNIKQYFKTLQKRSSFNKFDLKTIELERIENILVDLDKSGIFSGYRHSSLISGVIYWYLKHYKHNFMAQWKFSNIFHVSEQTIRNVFNKLEEMSYKCE